VTAASKYYEASQKPVVIIAQVVSRDPDKNRSRKISFLLTDGKWNAEPRNCFVPTLSDLECLSLMPKDFRGRGDELRIPHILEEKENATLVNSGEVGIGVEARCVPNFYARMCKVSPIKVANAPK
jgi:hypothetical protein